MKALLLSFFMVALNLTFSQEVIDSFADGNFTSSPAWSGDTDDWTVVANSDAGPDAANSYTLRLNTEDASTNAKYLSIQRLGSWGTEQSWGFWIGRRNNSPGTYVNRACVWLWASESNINSPTIDGYRISLVIMTEETIFGWKDLITVH